MRRAILSGLIALSAAVSAGGGPDFADDVRPLLEAHCCSCHSGELAKSGLRLDLKEAAFAGGDGWGPAIVPGRADDSPLIQFARGDDPDLLMPPEESGVPRLSPADVALLVEWVNAGAVWPDGVDTAHAVDKTDHWAFRPVLRPVVPDVRQRDWPRNDIDRFILARLEAEELPPSPEADRREWIRRITLDVTGLPPTPAEVHQFLADRSPDAHEQVIERLLTSPRYGERYAQHWLDIVRYADTHGYEVNTERPNAWPYRDYVIEAFNDDLPYDQFVREQIAGAEPGREASTGFLVTAAVLLPGQIGQDDASKRAARQDALNDIIVTTSETVLGLTVGCARCHDHKFDPVSARDYYALQSFFAGVEYGERPLQTPDSQAVRRERDQARDRIAEIDRMLHQYYPFARAGETRPAVTARLNTERIEAVSARRVRFTILDTNSLEACIDELEVYDTAGRNVALASTGVKPSASGSLVVAGRHELAHINDGQYGNGRSWLASQRSGSWVMLEFPERVTIERIVWSRDRQAAFADRTPTAYRIEVSAELSGDDTWKVVADSEDRSPFGATPPATLNGRSAAEQAAVTALEEEKAALVQRLESSKSNALVFAGIFRNPDVTYLLHRGDAEQRREELGPETLAAFAPVIQPVSLPKNAPESDRRIALANWLTDPGHPLPARTMVNRIWQWHFGTGIVETPNDLGRNGSQPTHPELLDWLADEFVQSGWSVKHIHRLILSSATYRQSGTANPTGLSKDRDSRFLWRFPPRRLEAEAIRDSMLAVSGRLNPQMGGPGFDLFNARGGLSGFEPIETFGAAGRRRMIYAHKVRMVRDAVFGAFDCPDAGQSLARRRQSTTPIQALNLFNSPFTIDEAQAFATRIEADVDAGLSEHAVANDQGDLRSRWIDRAYQLAFARSPDPAELKTAQEVVEKQGLPTLCRVLFNANEFVFVP
jgi:hypothetical protein